MVNIGDLARSYGFDDNYTNKLNTANSYIIESAEQDRKGISSQLNNTLSEYERDIEKQKQQQEKDSSAAYVDLMKAINPYSTDRSNAQRMGLGNSGFNESSLIGANNAYQNRYTTTKNNYDNLFADINQNMKRAKETADLELAKITKTEQERMLENLWRFNDEWQAELQRREQVRQWEAQMALYNQQQAAARAGGSGGTIVSTPTTTKSTGNTNSNILATNEAKMNNKASNTNAFATAWKK